MTLAILPALAQRLWWLVPGGYGFWNEPCIFCHIRGDGCLFLVFFCFFLRGAQLAIHHSDQMGATNTQVLSLVAPNFLPLLFDHALSAQSVLVPSPLLLWLGSRDLLMR